MKTFKPGEIARAEDVNANFTEIKNIAEQANAAALAAVSAGSQAMADSSRTRTDLTQQLTTGIQGIPAQVNRAIEQKMFIGYHTITNPPRDQSAHKITFTTPLPDAKYDVIVTIGGILQYSGSLNKYAQDLFIAHDITNKTREGFTVLVLNKSYSSDIKATITYLVIRESQA